MSTYSLFQSTFAMCMASNAVSDLQLPVETLETYLANYLSGGQFPGDGQNGVDFSGFFNLTNPDMAGGDWKVAWGPVLTTDPSVEGSSVFSRNAMYVAHSPSLSAYVVAVSGTNPDDVYDWIVEDLYVLPSALVAWPPKSGADTAVQATAGQSTTQPCISGGTAIGLSNLLGMQSAGVDLKTFLQSVAGDAGKLIFTGHSLGGALSPTLALYLYPDPTPATSGWGEIRVLPVAGATPGNQQFVNLFNATYKVTTSDDGVHFWNTNYQNYHDLVPRAWNKLADVIWLKTIKPPKLTSIFGDIDYELGGSLGATFLTIAHATHTCNYQAVNNLGFTTDWGYYQFPIVAGYYGPVAEWLPFPAIDEITTMKELAPIARAAHVSQYERYFQVTPIPPLPLPVRTVLAAKRGGVPASIAGEA